MTHLAVDDTLRTSTDRAALPRRSFDSDSKCDGSAHPHRLPSRLLWTRPAELVMPGKYHIAVAVVSPSVWWTATAGVGGDGEGDGLEHWEQRGAPQRDRR